MFAKVWSGPAGLLDAWLWREWDFAITGGGDVRVAGGDDHDRAAAGVCDELVEDDLAPVLVQGRGRFVGEDQVGIGGERAGDRDALALPAGEGADELRGVVAEPEPIQRGGRAPRDVARVGTRRTGAAARRSPRRSASGPGTGSGG